MKRRHFIFRSCKKLIFDSIYFYSHIFDVYRSIFCPSKQSQNALWVCDLFWEKANLACMHITHWSKHTLTGPLRSSQWYGPICTTNLYYEGLGIATKNVNPVDRNEKDGACTFYQNSLRASEHNYITENRWQEKDLWTRDFNTTKRIASSLIPSIHKKVNSLFKRFPTAMHSW